MSAEYIRGRTVLVTGSTDGIGLQTAMELAVLGADVVLHGRTEERVNQAIIAFRQQGLNAAGAVLGDFSSFASVRAMSAQLRSSFPTLSVLVNNAGVYMTDHVLTGDGYEMTWQVNHLSVMLLTQELLLVLKDNPSSRIVNVSSIAHTRGSLAFENLNGEQGYDAYGAYAQSKLANVLFTYGLDERLHGSGTTANCLHPGVIETKLLMEGFGMKGASLEEGAATSVYLASSDAVAHISGKYFDKKRETRSAPVTYDRTIMMKLWDVSLEMINPD